MVTIELKQRKLPIIQIAKEEASVEFSGQTVACVHWALLLLRAVAILVSCSFQDSLKLHSTKQCTQT
jgi:hypothetical protein